MKKCSKCGKRKPNTKFWEDRSTIDGCSDRCKWCCAGQPTKLKEAKNEVEYRQARVESFKNSVKAQQKLLRESEEELTSAKSKLKKINN